MQVGGKLVLLDMIKHVLEIKKKIILFDVANKYRRKCVVMVQNYITIIKPCMAQLYPIFFGFHGN